MALLKVTASGRLLRGPGGGWGATPAEPVVLPTIGVADAGTVTEGTDPDATFTVSLSGVAPANVTFTYATQSGTASSPADYTHVSGAGTIPQGETSTAINVPIVDDDVFRGTRGFTLAISNATCNGQGLVITQASGACTILDDEAPEVTGSPYDDNVHPRIFLVPEGYSLEGAPTPDELRDRIATSYVAEFQATINAVNSRIDTSNPASQDLTEMLFDMHAASQIALLDPAEMVAHAPSLNFGGKTKSDYLTKVRAQILAMMTREFFVSSKRLDDEPHTQPYSLYTAAAISNYLGAGGTFTTEDIQAIANAVIFASKRRNINYPDKAQLVEQGTKSIVRGQVIALALKGESMPGNWPTLTSGSTTYTNTNGQSYEEAIEQIAQNCLNEFTFMLNTGEAWFESRGGWAEGPLYSRAALIALMEDFAAVASCTGTNIFAQYGWLRHMPYWYLQHIKPTPSGYASHGLCHKYGAGYEHSPVIQTMHSFAAFLEQSEPAASKALTHWRTTRYSGVGNRTSTSTSANRYTYCYPTYLYLWGHKHLPAAAPSTMPSEWPLHQRHGDGQYCFRTSNDYDPEALWVWFSCKTGDRGGHDVPDPGFIAIHRAGALTCAGSNTKNAGSVFSSGARNIGSTFYQEGCRLAIARATDPLLGAKLQTRRATGAMTTDPARHAFCAQGVCYATTEKAALNQPGYGYVWFDNSGSWDTSLGPANRKASLHIREVAVLMPENGGEPYVIVMDRVEQPDPERDLAQQQWKTPYRPQILDGATETRIEGPGGYSSLNPHTAADPNEHYSGEYQSTARRLRMRNAKTNGNGVLFMTLLEPTTVDTRIVGGDFNGFARDYSTPRLSTNEDDGTTGTATADWYETSPSGSTRTWITDNVARWHGRWKLLWSYGGERPAQQHFITVLQPSLDSTHGSGSGSTVTALSAGPMRGAQIDDPARKRIFLCPANVPGNTVSDAFAYTVVGLGSGVLAHHTLVGLLPSTNYQITRQTVGGNTTFTVTPNAGSLMTTPQGTLGVTI